MYISTVSTAQPKNYYDQTALLKAFEELWAQTHHNIDRVRRLHEAVKVGGRFLALDMDEYKNIKNFTESNDHFIRVGTDLAEEVLRKGLEASNTDPSELDAIFFVSVTGIATPSIDARLVNRLGLRSDIKRIPIFGLGCVAGAAGLGRLYDYLKAYPDHKAALISVELCSLTLQPQDLSIANLIASGLFGDGASCVIGFGDNHRPANGPSSPKVLGSRSRFYPNTEEVMGWKIGHQGFKVILKASVPQMAEQYLGHDVAQFLESYGLEHKDIKHWVCHTGGPKVLLAFQKALSLPDSALTHSWDSLNTVGNLSSSSVLYVLKKTLAEDNPQAGEYGVLLAMGPGFCCEMVLFQC